MLNKISLVIPSLSNLRYIIIHLSTRDNIALLIKEFQIRLHYQTSLSPLGAAKYIFLVEEIYDGTEIRLGKGIQYKWNYVNLKGVKIQK